MKKLIIPTLFIGTIAMIVVMAKTGATLKTPVTPKGILDLEFAYTTAKTTVVTEAWANNNFINNITVAKINTCFDFIFLFFYSFFLFFTNKKIAEISSGKFGTIGLIIAKGALLAGLFDIAENVGMLITLSGFSSGTIAFITTICSLIKWGLAFIAIAYCIVGLTYLTGKRKLHWLFLNS